MKKEIQSMPSQSSHDLVTMIDPPKKGSPIDVKELFAYRELFFFLVWRDVKVTYAQTIMGFGWAFLQPLIQILVFTLIFGKIAKVATDGIPYFLFTTMAILPWTYISTALTASSQSLITNQGMMSKVYFPRLFFPLRPAVSRLVDFAISLLLIVPVMWYYDVAPTASLLWLPLFLALMIAVPVGAGLWLAALAVRFRDVKFALQFIIRMLMFSAPIVYSASALAPGWRLLYSLNPLVAVIEGMRACLLGLPIPWPYILPGVVTTVIILVTGAFYFKRMERVFADVA
jgi:lipopolysaccharide transport system permease protein